MKRRLVVLMLFSMFYSMRCSAQFDEYNSGRHKVDQKLMISLGSWASLNIIGSGIGWATAPNDEMKSFHQMNTYKTYLIINFQYVHLVMDSTHIEYGNHYL